MRKIIITTLFICMLLFSSVYAEEIEYTDLDQTVLTLEEAVEMAYTKSINLKSLQIEIDKLYEQRKRADQMVDFFVIDSSSSPVFGVGGDAVHAGIVGAINGLVSIDRQWQIAQKRYEMEKESLAYRVYVAYHDILRTQREVELARLSLEKTQSELNIVTIKNQFGISSAFELNRAKQTVQSSNDTLNSKQASLTIKYNELNKLIGIDNVTDIDLIDDTANEEIIDMNDFDLEHHINRLKATSPVVWINEQQVFLAQLALDNYTYNQNSYDTYRVKQLDVSNARNRVAITKEQLENTARDIYARLKEIELTKQELLTAENTLQDAYDNFLVRYNLGLATRIEMIQLQEQLETLKVQKDNLYSQYIQLTLVLKKPWIIGG